VPSVPYLADSAALYARERLTPELVNEVRSTITESGFWEINEEWRISTYMFERIEIVENRGRRWFKVTVGSANEMTCHAPTLERALEHMAVFERLVMDLFWTLGWPSWATVEQARPGPTDTLA
jgi:hypothetical protein